MKRSYIRNTKLNISMTFLSQIVTSLCNFILSGVLLNTYGAVLYGITSSVNQFLSYISLLEGGVGRVGRAEMYAPLAKSDYYGVSRVYYALKRFFCGVGIICIAYILFLSLAYFDFADTEQYSRKYIFTLVWILGITTLSKYLGGLTNLCLLVADQKQYVANSIIAITTILGVVMALFLVNSQADMLYVKLICGIAYAARPIAYSLYVRKNYQLSNVKKDYSKLPQKWSGLGQNVAFFLHSNTDIVLLTLFADIRLVAVYSVYSTVISNIRLIAITFSSGMEGAMGEVYSSGDLDLLRKTYRKYQFTMFFAVAVLFGTTTVLILPFIKMYTRDVTDINCVQPIFALLFVLAEALECVMHPCSTLAVSTNQIRETRWAYYFEVIINVSLSTVLIWWDPLKGLIIATLTAITIKNLFFAGYAAVKILNIRISELIMPQLLISIKLVFGIMLGWKLLNSDRINSYLQWAFYAVPIVFFMGLSALVMSAIFYRKDMKQFIKKFYERKNTNRQQ